MSTRADLKAALETFYDEHFDGWPGRPDDLRERFVDLFVATAGPDFLSRVPADYPASDFVLDYIWHGGWVEQVVLAYVEQVTLRWRSRRWVPTGETVSQINNWRQLLRETSFAARIVLLYGWTCSWVSGKQLPPSPL